VLGDQVLDHADALEPRADTQRLGHLALVDAGHARQHREGLLRVRDLELDQQAAQLALVACQRAVQQQCTLGRVQLQQLTERVDVLLDQRGVLLQVALEPLGGGVQRGEQVLRRVLDVLVDVEEERPFFIRPVPGAVALKLVPRRAEPEYEFLVVVVDPGSLKWRALATRDRQGGDSTLIFSNLKENQGLSDKDFVFRIPRGVQVLSDDPSSPRDGIRK